MVILAGMVTMDTAVFRLPQAFCSYLLKVTVPMLMIWQ